MAYAAVSDVQARLQGTGRTISASSQPNITQVTQWLAEADARINGRLAAIGVAVPVTDSNGIEILKSHACDYAEGHTRNTAAAGGGDGANIDGNIQLDRFEKYLDFILDNPGVASAELSSGSIATGALGVRSHVTDDFLGRASDDPDFDPQFKKADGADQF